MSVQSTPAAVDAALSRFARTTEEVFTLEELRRRMLSGKQMSLKYGVDLTAPELHIGHAVNLWMYRGMQELGHKIVLLLGDFTTQIGDPTGKSKTRPVLGADEIDRNAKAILDQALMVLIDDPEVLEIRKNSEWLNAMQPAELLTVFSQVTVDRLLSRDMFRRRMAEGASIAVHELLYPILQGQDSVALTSDMTIIGSDQLFNEMMGRTLQERAGQDPQVVLTTKITPGLDGREKQSKSLGNYVAIGHSPREKFGRLMRLPDDLVGQWFSVYTDVPDERIAAVVELGTREPMAAKYELAKAIVARYHGDDAAGEEEAWFRRTFSDRVAPEDAPTVDFDLAAPTVFELVHALLAERSTSEIRRLIAQGGVRIDERKATDMDEPVSLSAEPLAVKIGKRNWYQVRYLG